jgi:hypothetical protein
VSETRQTKFVDEAMEAIDFSSPIRGFEVQLSAVWGRVWESFSNVGEADVGLWDFAGTIPMM